MRIGIIALISGGLLWFALAGDAAWRTPILLEQIRILSVAQQFSIQAGWVSHSSSQSPQRSRALPSLSSEHVALLPVRLCSKNTAAQYSGTVWKCSRGGTLTKENLWGFSQVHPALLPMDLSEALSARLLGIAKDAGKVASSQTNSHWDFPLCNAGILLSAWCKIRRKWINSNWEIRRRISNRSFCSPCKFTFNLVYMGLFYSRMAIHLKSLE